jgi:hypothetical protein
VDVITARECLLHHQHTIWVEVVPLSRRSLGDFVPGGAVYRPLSCACLSNNLLLKFSCGGVGGLVRSVP